MPSKKKAKENEACCYCCFILIIIVIIMVIIALIVTYWYVALPIIGGVLFFAYIYQQQQRKKLVNLLDTIPNQQEYKRITGYNAVENDEFTDKYKAWLLRKAGISRIKLFTNPKVDSIQITQPRSYPPQQEKSNVPSNLQFEEKTKFCPTCGSKNKINAKYCASCGNELN